MPENMPSICTASPEEIPEACSLWGIIMASTKSEAGTSKRVRVIIRDTLTTVRKPEFLSGRPAEREPPGCLYFITTIIKAKASIAPSEVPRMAAPTAHWRPELIKIGIRITNEPMRTICSTSSDKAMIPYFSRPCKYPLSKLSRGTAKMAGERQRIAKSS
ncbi:hypothetical protein D3C85_1057560 [compost metagenome]